MGLKKRRPGLGTRDEGIEAPNPVFASERRPRGKAPRMRVGEAQNRRENARGERNPRACRTRISGPGNWFADRAAGKPAGAIRRYSCMS